MSALVGRWGSLKWTSSNRSLVLVTRYQQWWGEVFLRWTSFQRWGLGQECTLYSEVTCADNGRTGPPLWTLLIDGTGINYFHCLSVKEGPDAVVNIYNSLSINLVTNFNHSGDIRLIQICVLPYNTKKPEKHTINANSLLLRLFICWIWFRGDLYKISRKSSQKRKRK